MNRQHDLEADLYLEAEAGRDYCPDDDDAIRPVRGIVIAVAIGVVIWALILIPLFWRK